MDIEKIKQVQKEAWNKSSAGWKKWDELMMRFLQPMNAEMIQLLDLRASDHVLDVATGTGEPGLSIASILINGRVTATDISENMVLIANENAALRSIHNFEAICCEASDLPFADESFDAITCRLGFMFFPDIDSTLSSMMRVLKPGGKIIASVWNSSDRNSWISNSMDIMIQQLQLNPPAPGAPGAFRCSEIGFMHSYFKNGGLKNILETEVNGKMPCGSIETYWNFISEVAAPLAFSKAEQDKQQEIKNEVIARVKEQFPDGNVQLDSSATIIIGQK